MRRRAMRLHLLPIETRRGALPCRDPRGAAPERDPANLHGDGPAPLPLCRTVHADVRPFCMATSGRRTAARLAERGMASRLLSGQLPGGSARAHCGVSRRRDPGVPCRAKCVWTVTSARLSDVQSVAAYRGRRMMTSMPPYCLSPPICAKALSVVHMAHAFARRASAMCIQSTGPIPTCRYLLPLRACGVVPL